MRKAARRSTSALSQRLMMTQTKKIAITKRAGIGARKPKNKEAQMDFKMNCAMKATIAGLLARLSGEARSTR